MSGQGALQGQVAIVTGAGRGIGHAVATALAREGATVVLAARTRQQLAAIAAAIRESGGARARDSRRTSRRTRPSRRWWSRPSPSSARLDILVTAAGGASFGPVVATKPEDWDGMLAVNLRAVMVTCRAVLPMMIRQRRGTIINIASVATQRAIPGAAVYTATKAGVVGFSRVLAEELRSGRGPGGGAGSRGCGYATLGHDSEFAGP